ncbi:Fibronectin type III domain protein [Desulfatibacillum aliphaticivorans]|uniref:Fibronectin type III domain protein n=1 Tax=Desulfatibacillum aliphaticivorans TaxID=218208 RepID=B8FL98_DESAL|nr:DUF2012 domain-containing protein [Desulfatibacillum aliphaticivorans]ACL05044.1 Fibronectin type III domain protein [Desulfatibacillum aliphaticivorans]
MSTNIRCAFRWSWQSLLVSFLIFHTSLTWAAPPETPTGLTAIAGNGEISLSWDASVDATSYAVYRADSINGPYQFAAQTKGAGFTNRSLANGSTYYFTVAALGEDGRSEDSSPISASPTSDVLASPAQLKAYTGKGQASLSWNAVTSAVSYNVWRSEAPGGPYALLTPPAPGPSFTDVGLTDGTTYYYVVQTMSDSPGAYSGEAAVTPSSALQAAPTNFAADPGSTWASLSWSPSVGAEGYNVYRSTTLGGPYEFAGMAQSAGFEDFSLANGSTYYYRAAAVNDYGQGALSAEASAAVAADQKPHAPIIYARKTGSGEITLDWWAAAGAVSYKVHRGATSGGPYTDLGVQTTGFTDTGLENGTAYFYVVDSHNASDVTARSNEAAITPSVILPPPSNITVTPGNTQATVNWQPVTGATQYYVDVKNSSTGVFVTGGSSSGAGCTVTSLTNGVEYYVTVQSSGGTISAASASLNFTPSAALPLFPENLSAPETGNGQVSLKWSPANGAIGYQVFKRTHGAPWPSTPTATVSGTLYTDGGLTNGSQYYYRVASINENGPGACTQTELRVIPTDAAPPAPEEIAVEAGNTEATVFWKPVPGASSYYITIADSLGGNYTAGGSSDNPAFTVTGLTNGQAYYARVQAASYAGVSAFSEEIEVMPDVALPLAPQNLSAPAVGNTQASLQWSQTPGATGYRIYRRTLAEAWPQTPIADVEGCLFTDSQLDNGVQCSYKIAAYNASGEGAWTGSAKNVTPIATVQLAPLGPAALPGNTEATVTWRPVEGASGYYITVSETAGGAYFNGGSAGDQLSYKATGLSNGKSYYLRIQATGDSASAFSREVTVAPSANLPLSPANFSRTVLGNTQVSLAWNSVDGADSYILRRRNGGDSWEGAWETPVNSLSFTDTELVNGSKYVYQVNAVNAAGSGAWCEQEVSAVPYSTPPKAPVNVTVEASDSQVEVSWNAVSGATDYYVTVTETPGGSWAGGGSTGGPASYVVSGLNNNQTYYFRVQAMANDLWSAYSQEVSATPSLPPDHGAVTGVVTISVAGHTDLGVANASITIQGTDYSTTTAADGSFTLNNVPFGDYVLVISAPGMDTTEVNVSLSETSYQATIPQMVLTQTNGVQGDADGDGQLGMPDAVYILQVLTEVRTLTP